MTFKFVRGINAAVTSLCGFGFLESECYVCLGCLDRQVSMMLAFLLVVRKGICYFSRSHMEEREANSETCL